MEQVFLDTHISKISKDMKAQFVRGAKTKKEILDTILGRVITLDMPSYDVVADSNGKLSTTDENTKYLVKQLKKAKVQYEVIEQDDTYVWLSISGTKDNLFKILPLWDAMGRSESELRNDLADWEGDQETIDNELY
jgi:hypothetical protein